VEKAGELRLKTSFQFQFGATSSILLHAERDYAQMPCNHFKNAWNTSAEHSRRVTLTTSIASVNNRYRKLFSSLGEEVSSMATA
jgi:hypothetical protein